ncbi:MAG: hypothetical protein JOZ88_02390 [Hyphomicrobiales bacterium]|nr:hypothetical protein [Hyphomicrobiales bacterium]
MSRNLACGYAASLFTQVPFSKSMSKESKLDVFDLEVTRASILILNPVSASLLQHGVRATHLGRINSDF